MSLSETDVLFLPMIHPSSHSIFSRLRLVLIFPDYDLLIDSLNIFSDSIDITTTNIDHLFKTALFNSIFTTILPGT
jgi:hypothetical protein